MKCSWSQTHHTFLDTNLCRPPVRVNQDPATPQRYERHRTRHNVTEDKEEIPRIVYPKTQQHETNAKFITGRRVEIYIKGRDSPAADNFTEGGVQSSCKAGKRVELHWRSGETNPTLLHQIQYCRVPRSSTSTSSKIYNSHNKNQPRKNTDESFRSSRHQYSPAHSSHNNRGCTGAINTELKIPRRGSIEEANKSCGGAIDAEPTSRRSNSTTRWDRGTGIKVIFRRKHNTTETNRRSDPKHPRRSNVFDAEPSDLSHTTLPRTHTKADDLHDIAKSNLRRKNGDTSTNPQRETGGLRNNVTNDRRKHSDTGTSLHRQAEGLRIIGTQLRRNKRDTDTSRNAQGATPTLRRARTCTILHRQTEGLRITETQLRRNRRDTSRNAQGATPTPRRARTFTKSEDRVHAHRDRSSGKTIKENRRDHNEGKDRRWSSTRILARINTRGKLKIYRGCHPHRSQQGLRKEDLTHRSGGACRVTLRTRDRTRKGVQKNTLKEKGNTPNLHQKNCTESTPRKGTCIPKAVNGLISKEHRPRQTCGARTRVDTEEVSAAEGWLVAKGEGRLSAAKRYLNTKEEMRSSTKDYHRQPLPKH